MRLFFALWPDEDLLSRLVPHSLEVARICGGRPIAPATLHMTLSYAGLVEPARVKDLVAIGDSIRLPAFTYTIDVAASFGKAAVAWLAADRTPAPLIELQQTLSNKSLEAFFPKDPRPFRPHLSIMRNITRAVDPWKVQETSWMVNRFYLVAAHAADERVHYETLREWRLG